MNRISGNDAENNNLYLLSEKGVNSIIGTINKSFLFIKPVLNILSRFLALLKISHVQSFLQTFFCFNTILIIGFFMIQYDFKQKKKLHPKITQGHSKIIHRSNSLYHLHEFHIKIAEKKKIILDSMELLQMEWQHKKFMNQLNWLFHSLKYLFVIYLTITIEYKIEPIAVFYILQKIFFNTEILFYKSQEIITMATQWYVINEFLHKD